MEKLTELEMSNLNLVKTMLNEAMRDELVFYDIERVWLDFSAKIEHTTIVAYPYESQSWQIFYPKELDKIKSGEFTLNDLNELVKKNKLLISGK